jgi:Ca-activated chloride channel family protein
MTALSAFHFLRPAWLLLLLPATWLCWRLWRLSDSTAAWRGAIAPHLLDALVVEPAGTQGRLRPTALLAVALGLGITALAGPAWERQPAPFGEDQAAVFLVVKVTPSMLAQDIPPSRLERAVQKIGDFLELKPGQKTGLIAYAGTAHLAMPLTTDADIIRTFAAALEPEAMPVEGDNPLAAVRLADERLRRAAVTGSIVLITDDVAAEAIPEFQAYRSEGGTPVHLLAVAGGPDVVPPPGSPPALPLDEDRMEQVVRAAGGDLFLVSPDESDVTKLASSVERGIRSVADDEQDQWRDMGYWLLPALLLLLIPFFRPGGAVAFE